MESHDAFERCYTYSTVENILELGEQFVRYRDSIGDIAWDDAGGSRGMVLIAIEAGQAFTNALINVVGEEHDCWWAYSWWPAIDDYAVTLRQIAETMGGSWPVICGVNTGKVDAGRERLTQLAEISIRKELT